MASRGASKLPVILGSLQLTALEVPESYDRGGSMQPVVHRLVGGGRVVQLLGPDPARRRLRGLFTGPGAAERAQLLEAMRDAGDRISLTIGVWQEFVVVTSVVLRYEAQGSIVQYLLEAEVLPGGGAGLVAGAAAVLSAAAAQIAQAGLDADFLGLSAATAGLTTASLAIAASQRTMTTPDVDLSVASGAFATSLTAGEASMAALASAAPSGSLVASSAALTAATRTAGTLAAAVQATSFTSCAASNLALL